MKRSMVVLLVSALVLAGMLVCLGSGVVLSAYVTAERVRQADNARNQWEQKSKQVHHVLMSVAQEQSRQIEICEREENGVPQSFCAMLRQARLNLLSSVANLARAQESVKGEERE